MTGGLQRGAEYEAWAFAQAAAIWSALGIDVSAITFEAQVSFRGVTESRWRVDVVGTDGRHLLLLECKDEITKPQEVASTIWRFADIAAANPDHVVHGAMAFARLPSGDPKTILDAAEVLLRDRPNLRPTRLLITARELVSGVLLGWTIDQGSVHAVVATHLRPTRELDGLLHGLGGHSFIERLASSLEIRGHPEATSELRLRAQVESSMCHLHLGAVREALLDAQEIQELAAKEHTFQTFGYSASVLELSARTKQQLLRGRGRRPGARHVAAVHRLIPQLDPRNAVGALHLAGAWHGLVGDTDDARRLLQQARLRIDDSDEGHYQEFITRVRLIELTDMETRAAQAESLRPLVPQLTPIAQEPARILIERLQEGEDVSIASAFTSRTTQPENHGD